MSIKDQVIEKLSKTARKVGGYYAVNEEWSVRKYKTGSLLLFRWRSMSSVKYHIDPITPESDAIWGMVAEILKLTPAREKEVSNA